MAAHGLEMRLFLSACPLRAASRTSVRAASAAGPLQIIRRSLTSTSHPVVPRPRPSPQRVPRCASALGDGRSSPLARQSWRQPASTAVAAAAIGARGIASKKARRFEVIRQYEDLPTDYRDVDGLAFSDKELGGAEVANLFGASMSAGEANRLLRILHGRRVAGTLEDPTLAANTAEYSREDIQAALDHLRRRVPVDEIINAGLRAQDELDEMDRLLQKQEADEGRAEAVPDKDPVYGFSALDTIRARNKARREAEEREREEQERLREETLGPLATREQQAEQRQPSAQMQRYMDQALLSTSEEPPQMSHYERLVPLVSFFVILAGVMATLCWVYRRPEPAERLLGRFSEAQVTVGAIVGLNVLVYAMWKVPPLWRMLNTSFYLTHAIPRVSALVGSVFSHMRLSHLAINMVTLWYFGTKLHDEVDRMDFLTIFLLSGVGGFVGSTAYFTLRGILEVSTLGASGATIGVGAAYFWEHSLDRFKIFGLPPDPLQGVPGVVFLALVFGMNLGTMSFMIKRGLDMPSHLCGGVIGISVLEMIKRVKGKAEEREASPQTVDFWTGTPPARTPASGAESNQAEHVEQEEEQEEPPTSTVADSRS